MSTRKLLMFMCILLILSSSLTEALADTSVSHAPSTYDDDELEQMVAENTASWEKIYGPHELWDYSINAKYASTFGTLAGGYNTSWLPVEPSDDALPFDDAVSIAKDMLSKQDSRFNDDYFSMLTVASSYIVADMPSTYFSQQGTWIIEFWSTLNEALQKISYVYIDAHTRDVPLMMIAIDQNAPDDYDHILVIENPSQGENDYPFNSCHPKTQTRYSRPSPQPPSPRATSKAAHPKYPKQGGWSLASQ